MGGTKLRKADWHHYANTVLKSLPQGAASRSQHKSFNDVFRSSKLATIPVVTSNPPSFFARHQQPYPQHQVLSSFNAAHRRGDWGLKRPLPPVKDAHIVITEIDTQERQTPYTFATEKPRFVRRMREIGLVLNAPSSTSENTDSYLLPERMRRRKTSPLEHLHPQWNRKVGGETGPWILGLDAKEFSKFLGKIPARGSELDSARRRLDSTRKRIRTTNPTQITDPTRITQLAQACLDLPLQSPPYKTHATAGLAYSTRGLIPSTTIGTRCDPTTLAGGPRKARIVRGTVGGMCTALVSGVVAKVSTRRQVLSPDRTVPVDVYPSHDSAFIDRQGRLDLEVSPSVPDSQKPRSPEEYTRRESFHPVTTAFTQTYRTG
jgi:Mitochondrial ribosomal protein subunit